ncbi:S-layer homology domain-containing protein [Ureibacillus chungkukjangi]|uniref:S-layer homology domain-containing protein n=1 Tax=Ureibacillus chungkukjangi TaxID=1202712 RepID=UPI00203D48D9|nr:S-layer homology domain-containing protein [Ureibacillus chungkukjangi]MCM3386831.1 S-layer homology domain-containing protein [Ureibacillus chungkukjangi]
MKKKTSKKLFNVALASAMVAGSVVAIAPTATEAASVTFKDLDSSNSHYAAIMDLVDRGIIKGYPDNTFKPGQSLTRAHAALILAKVLKLDTKNVTDPKFKDVPKSHPYYYEIAALQNAGIIKGYEDGTYGTTKTLTRGHMAVIIQNAFELEAGNATTPFKDVANHVYKEQITALYANGVTVGTTPTTYGAASNVTRGQFATFVVRAEEARENAVEKFVEIKDGQIVTTKGTYAIEGDLAKVFNAANAAALKDAKIDFKFAEQTAALASLERVAATPTSKRILGIASLTLVAGNATFDAGGYTIPEVTISGNNVKVNNVKADKLTIADKLTVSLTGVEAKEVAVSETTKLTLDAASSIGKLVLPEGKDVKDVISNYEQVKDQIKELVNIGPGGEETPVVTEPETPAPIIPGPPVGQPSKAEAAKSTVDTLISTLLDSTSSVWTEFGSKKANGFEFNGEHVTLADIKTAVEGKGSDLEAAALSTITIDNIPALLTISNIKVTSAGRTVANVNNTITADSDLRTVKDDLAEMLSKSSVASQLDSFIDRNTAAGMSLQSFVTTYGTFNIEVTFNDGSKLPYTYTLTIAQ